MALATAPQLAVFDLPLTAASPPALRASDRRAASHLPESILLRNVVWFCRLRWVVVAILLVFGALGRVPAWLSWVGLRPYTAWPFVAAATLTLANLGFLAHARALARSRADQGAEGNLWAQIVADLAILTSVVHFMGSLETFVAFAYLFHIVLACIFFPRNWSLLVTVMACTLYVGCVALEEAEVIPLAGIYANALLRDQMHQVLGMRLLNVGWAVVTWLVVWYLASHLSALVRARDAELAETNRRLVQAQEEKARHMLYTTHELKAPFAAIHANVQLLLAGHCGPLLPDGREVLDRISARCRRLAHEIQEMLQLANLQASEDKTCDWAELDLAEVLRQCLAQLEPTARQRGLIIETELRPAPTLAVEDHMKMLLGNLLANAITYSQPGGRVRVECAPRPPEGPRILIEDEGIGIAPEKLPRIFDAYYRTDEAVRHNRESTGLGLTIVRHIAQRHGIRVRVESLPGLGTRVTLDFPAPTAGPRPTRSRTRAPATALGPLHPLKGGGQWPTC